MGVLVEVHDLEKLERISHLDFPVLGVNNRDLKKPSEQSSEPGECDRSACGRPFPDRRIGVKDYRDFQVLKGADGFLIGKWD